MLNQTVLVGRLATEPKLNETESGKKFTNITLAVPRTYKNINGEYDTDFIDCTLWEGPAATTAEYCKKGDLVGVKGRIKTDTYEKDGITHYAQTVVAEKITFLSSSKQKEQ